MDSRVPLLIYPERWSLQALNMTNGWPTPLITLNVESICSETLAWREANTQRLYAFEAKHLSQETITYEEAMRYADSICEDLHIASLNIETTESEASVYRVVRLGMYNEPVTSTIFLSCKKGRIPKYHVVHELAHYIEYMRYRTIRHGIGFCDVYADLLGDYGWLKQPRRCMMEAGLVFSHD